MNSYPEYVESNSYWFDKVPSHWNKTRNKFVFISEKEVVGKQWGEYDLLTMGKGGVRIRDLDGGGKFPGSFENYQVVKPDQLVFCLFDLDETPRTVGLSSNHGMITSAYDVFSTNVDVDSRFINYFYQSIDDVKGLRPYYTGLRKVVRSETFGGITIYIPPLHEQILISNFLDKKTSQIDSLIEKTQRKILLLKEQRTSLINQCVTKGLDPNVEMKDSGIKWIGQIPKHWKVSKFGYVSLLETGNTPSKENEDLYYTTDENGFPWVKPSDLDVGIKGVNSTEQRLTVLGKSQCRVIPKDSVMICCIGNTSGKYSISNFEVSTNQQINSITFNNENIDPRYGLFFVDVFGRDLLKWMNFVTLPIISKGNLSQQPFLVPPIEEQNHIRQLLDSKLECIDNLIKMELERINLLKEYRQSLISNVVTGKVRVTEDIV